MNSWKDNLAGFALQKGHDVWESKVLSIVSALEQIPCKSFIKPFYVPANWVPSGTVAWVSEVFGRVVKPDYYPSFLSSWLKRNVWLTYEWPLETVFVKPARQHKLFNGGVSTKIKRQKDKKGPFWCSDIVHFKNEWRYYVSYGKVLTAEWYLGKDENKAAPTLNIAWPENWCGAADFGELDNGDIALVEANAPFACGWYGKQNLLYAQFITEGWKWLTTTNKISNMLENSKT